jgi:hypothetical protein
MRSRRRSIGIWSKRGRVAKMPRCFLFVSLFFVALLASGCKDVRVANDQDSRFLHSPEDLSAPVIAPKESLFPIQKGMLWRMTGPDGPEEYVMVGPEALSGSTLPGYRIEVRHTGAAVRSETYATTSDGTICQAITGGADKIVMAPPMPITAPLAADKATEWQGNLTFKGQTVPSRAWTRLRGMESVKTAAGTFDAYRFDVLLSTSIGGSQATFPTTRWFVPGIGMVKTTYRLQIPDENKQLVWREFTKELQSYKK